MVGNERALSDLTGPRLDSLVIVGFCPFHIGWGVVVYYRVIIICVLRYPPGFGSGRENGGRIRADLLMEGGVCLVCHVN